MNRIASPLHSDSRRWIEFPVFCVLCLAFGLIGRCLRQNDRCGLPTLSPFLSFLLCSLTVDNVNRVKSTLIICWTIEYMIDRWNQTLMERREIDFAIAIFITSLEESYSIVQDDVDVGDWFLIHRRIDFLSRRFLKMNIYIYIENEPRKWQHPILVRQRRVVCRAQLSETQSHPCSVGISVVFFWLTWSDDRKEDEKERKLRPKHASCQHKERLYSSTSNWDYTHLFSLPSIHLLDRYRSNPTRDR